MSDDLLIAAVREHARRIDQRVEPTARAGDLDEAERRLGFGLPSFYRRLLLENPFTGLPREVPITRPRGSKIDLSDRI